MGCLANPDPDLMARLALSAAFEPSDESVGLAVAEFGAEAVVEHLGGLGATTSQLAAHRQHWCGRDWMTQAKREVSNAGAAGVRFLRPTDDGWPNQLDDLDERAPLVLRLRGPLDLAAVSVVSVAIVGARSATRYGVWVAEEIAASVAADGVGVVSGGAFGIDAAAHRGSLAAAGETVLVSAAGVDLSVPLANDSLFEQVAQSGLIISEVPVGTRPSRHRFLIRNRLIAALAPVTLVVEAASRSGALATARDADALARTVAAVPGPITSAMSAGSNELLKSPESVVITSGADVVGLVRSLV